MKQSTQLHPSDENETECSFTSNSHIYFTLHHHSASVMSHIPN